MRKYKVAIVLILVVFLCLATIASAQISPRPGGPGSGRPPSVPLFQVPAFTPVGIPAITPCVPIKMTLSEKERIAVRNLKVGEWEVVYFCFPSAFAGKRLVWTSSNPNVALVDGQASWGLILGVGPGTATITAKTNDGSFAYSFQVVVR